MRIGMDYRAALRPRTGIGRYVAGLAPALAARGVDLRLNGIFWRGNLRSARQAPAGCRLVAWPLPTRLVEWFLPADAALGGVDLYHHTDFYLSPVRRGTPEVMTVHDVAFLRDPAFHPPRAAEALTGVLRRAADRCAAFLVPSEATASDMVTHLGMERDRIHVTPLGVALPNPSLGPPPHDGYLLAIGTIEPRKNHVRLIRALPEGARLKIVGRPGWLCDETVAIAAAHPRVELLGHVQELKLRGLVAGAAAIVYPSLLEGFGLPVLEALAAGRPLLTSDREPMRSIAGEAALLVDPEDEGALREGMRRLLGDEALRAELIRRGPVRAAEFSWGRCAEATEAAYRAVVT